MKPRDKYRELVDDLRRIEHNNRHLDPTGRLYLTDENVDRENVLEGNPHIERDSDEYWHRMFAAAGSAAGERARDYGFDINEALGYIVY